MTVKELKEKLQDLPDHMEVFISGGKTEFDYGLLNSVRIDDVVFSEDNDDDTEPKATVKCVILDEE